MQLYARFPPSAGEPPLQLRAFGKTGSLQPGETATVTLSLKARDLSTWSRDAAPQGGWQISTGQIAILVGASSRDIRLEHMFQLQEA